jgi:hypothetical protein
MVLNVPVYFVLNAIEAGRNYSVVVGLSLEASMNKSNNNTEQPSNDDSQ